MKWRTLILLFAAAAAPRARAEVAPDWYASLMSDRGIEVAADDRIFTLFAALNALGYDAGPLARRDPIPRPDLGPVREAVRQSAPMSAGLATEFEAFMDAHPLPLQAYVAFATALGPAPAFARGAVPAEAAQLGGLEGLLARYWAEAKLGPLYAKLLPQYRTALKGYLPRLDAAFAQADQMLESPHAEAPPSPVLVVNLLDAAGNGFGVRRGGGSVLVVGPGPAGQPDDLAAAVAAYATVRAGPLLAERADAVKGLPELVERVHRLGLPDGALSPADYLTRCFALAVAAESLPDAREGQLESAERSGCWLTAELDRSLRETPDAGEGGAIERFVTALGGLDARKIGPPGEPEPSSHHRSP